MKLVRFLVPAGAEKPGVVDPDGTVRDLTGHVPDIDGAMFDGESLAKLAALDLSQLPLVDSGTRIGPCVGGVSKIVGIGLNYFRPCRRGRNAHSR